MLDPEYLQHCTDELEKLFADLETSILEDAARRIAENKYANTSTAEHQLNRAKALGLQYDAMTHKMSEILDISESRVQEIITEASYGSISKDNVIFKEAYEKGIIHKFNYDEAGMKKIIIAGIKSTNGEIRNICKTTAKTAKKMLASALDLTYLSVQSGAFSQQEAIKTAVNDIAGKGITWINYESGAHRRIDTTVRTAIRSGVNQTACRCQDKNFDDMGGNLVEVTSHMGARPDHAEWQGKIYWRKKQYKNYRNFEIATKYGTGAGLGGWNCRHSFFPYFEGLSSKTFEHYRLEENEDRYKLDQEQRYNERKIREWKRRQAVHKAGGIDNTKEARKVKEWQKRQETFLKAHPDMKRNYAREMIEKRNSFIGLGANDKPTKYQAGTVIQRGKLTVTDKDTKIKVLKAYERRLSTLDHERAVVIAADGKVFEVIGTSGHVNPEVLGDSVLRSAVVTHNHPVHETEYTFSEADIRSYIESGMAVLRGIDDEYEYELSNIGETIADADELDWFHEKNARHADIAAKCRKRNLNYWRKKR